MVQLLWKHVLQILTKLNRHLPYDPEILFTDIFPREGEMNVYINVCLYKALYKNVCSHFTHNIQRLETIQMCTTGKGVFRNCGPFKEGNTNSSAIRQMSY